MKNAANLSLIAVILFVATACAFAEEKTGSIDKEQASKNQEWFDNPTSGWVGGILGTLCGIYGGVVGGLSGFLVQRGKCKRLMKGLFLAGIIYGVLSLSVGVIALILGQPWHVWYPFVLIGGITTVVVSIPYSRIDKAYAQAEQRKMQALDM